ncbi:YdiK family protein [Gracilibacillus sp. JCM 18860]
MHNDFSHLLTYIAVAFVLAFIYVETKRILVPILAHMAMNTFAVIGQLSLDPEEMEQMLEQVQFILVGGAFKNMRFSPLGSAIIYFILGSLFIYIGIKSADDTVFNFITLALAFFATIDFVVAIRLVSLHFKIKKAKKK